MMIKNKIVLGTWAWGDNNSYFGNSYDENHFRLVYEAAISKNLTFFDTATAYGSGRSEEILGNLIANTPRSELTISTKFTPQMAPKTDNPVQTMLDESLKRLKTDYIDYYWIHNDADVEKWTHDLLPVLKEGKIKHVGVSNHTLSEIKRVQEILAEEGFKLATVQNHLSLLDRSSETAGILDYCKENNLEFFAYMVLEQGALTGKYNVNNPFPAGSVRAQVYNDKLPELTDLVTKLEEIGKNYDLSAAQTAMAWALSKDTFPIIGVTKVNQVEDAAQVAATRLTKSEIQELEDVAEKINVNTTGSWEPDMDK
ncbi:aldo/keto reductase [Lactobacillus sp. PV037]|uniref:aldo/keto reductase n=1 Tax=Lactobacillus sp. PV037 TaxID=2594496 RepID=UPI00223EB956|nr:aldo/keto reductase [Lactobacillus sp. PV037]QNQ83675.1 aldo/keto reductase [Lactobacillus sp. PV037]